MAEFRNPSNRVTGRAVGRMTEGSKPAGYQRYQTPEQRAENDRQTLSSYAKWKADRDARLDRMSRMRIPEASELRHKDIIM